MFDESAPAAAPPEPRRRPSGRARALLLVLSGITFFQSSDVAGTTVRIDPVIPAADSRPDSWRSGRTRFRGPRLARATPQPGPRLAPADVAAFADAPFYDLKTLRTVFIQFPSSSWESELEGNYHRDVDVPATVTVDGRVYRDVG